ncbi:MAG: helix-turn-helix domain-containing protein [Aliishimia sp.]
MVQISSLSRLIRGAPWRMSLIHGAYQARVIWITHGHARVLLGARLRGTGVHNFLYIPAGDPFALEAGPGFNGHLVTLPENSRTIWPQSPLQLRVRDGATQAEVSGVFEALLREHMGQRPMHEDAMAAHLQLMSIWLGRQMELPETIPETSTAADRLSEAFLMDVELNYARGETMSAYARRLGVTPTHLTRVCKSQLGHSAADLIAQRTLYAARDLLETTRHPAKAIAASLGFSAAATFSRFIQTQTGQSPLTLRKAARNAPLL